MAEIKRMIAETETDLAAARTIRDGVHHARRFLEFAAFAAKIRLIALNDAMRAVEREQY